MTSKRCKLTQTISILLWTLQSSLILEWFHMGLRAKKTSAFTWIATWEFPSLKRLLCFIVICRGKGPTPCEENTALPVRSVFRFENLDFHRSSLDTALFSSIWHYFIFLRLHPHINSLSADLTKWSNTLKQFVGNLLTNCLNVFDCFVKLALKGLIELIIQLADLSSSLIVKNLFLRLFVWDDCI